MFDLGRVYTKVKQALEANPSSFAPSHASNVLPEVDPALFLERALNFLLHSQTSTAQEQEEEVIELEEGNMGKEGEEGEEIVWEDEESDTNDSNNKHNINNINSSNKQKKSSKGMSASASVSASESMNEGEKACRRQLEQLLPTPQQQHSLLNVAIRFVNIAKEDWMLTGRKRGREEKGEGGEGEKRKREEMRRRGASKDTVGSSFTFANFALLSLLFSPPFSSLLHLLSLLQVATLLASVLLLSYLPFKLSLSHNRSAPRTHKPLLSPPFLPLSPQTSSQRNNTVTQNDQEKGKRREEQSSLLHQTTTLWQPSVALCTFRFALRYYVTRNYCNG